jgi:hypothetical protein
MQDVDAISTMFSTATELPRWAEGMSHPRLCQARVFDITGNVWTWCLNVYRDEVSSLEDVTELDGGPRRSIRGALLEASRFPRGFRSANRSRVRAWGAGRLPRLSLGPSSVRLSSGQGPQSGWGVSAERERRARGQRAEPVPRPRRPATPPHRGPGASPLVVRTRSRSTGRLEGQRCEAFLYTWIFKASWPLKPEA